MKHMYIYIYYIFMLNHGFLCGLSVRFWGPSSSNANKPKDEALPKEAQPKGGNRSEAVRSRVAACGSTSIKFQSHPEKSYSMQLFSSAKIGGQTTWSRTGQFHFVAATAHGGLILTPGQLGQAIQQDPVGF